MNTPRIRTDLQATPAEEGGIKYFDVSDPRSGSRMRMYDFEWLIAERMDGRRAFDEVASWARERLGIQPSAADLEDYARRLRELGFFELDTDEAAPLRATPTAPTMMAEAPVLPATNGAVKSGELDSGKTPIPMAAEAPPLGNTAPPPVPARAEAREEERPRNTGPMATAPTTAMPVVAPPPQMPAPTPRPSAPRPVAEPPRAVAEPPRAVAEPPRAVAEPRAKMADAAEPPRSSIASIVGIVVVLLLVGALVAYVKLMGGSSTAKVATVVATPREVVQLYDGAATIKKSEGQTLAFGEAGTVSDVVAAGTEAKAGMPLATLDSYAKLEKELADVKDREAYYSRQLEAAKAKNEPAAIKAAEAKVAEKKKLTAEYEARVAKVRLVAPGPGTVAAVLVQAGARAQAGQPVVRLADARAMATFTLPPTDAGQMKPGQAVSLQAAAGGAPMAGRVAKIEGDGVTVEVAEDAPAKPGDQVRLVKARVPNVIPVPATALVHRAGGDVVYVLADGAVHERKVTVVDRSGTEVLVGSGLQSGDEVVSAGADSLHDGQKAAQQ